MSRPGGFPNTLVPLVAALAVLVLATLIVAWALEDIIYFSLFAGIPAGVASAALAYLVLRWLATRGRRRRP